MGATDRDYARRVRDAVAIEHEIRGAGADVDGEHAVLALLGRGDHVARGEAREHEFANFEIKTADDVDVVGEALLLSVHVPVADFELSADEISGEVGTSRPSTRKGRRML